MERSKKSIAREAQRNSPEMADFKNRIEKFMDEVKMDDEIRKYVKSDLAKMTNMPFYGEKIKKNKRYLPDEIVIEYVKYFKEYYDLNNKNLDFIEEILKWLRKNQNQSIRKLCKRTKEQKERAKKICKNNKPKNCGVWEHPIPACVITDVIVEGIKTNKLKDVNEFIRNINIHCYQVFLTHKQDEELTNKGYKQSMPPSFNYKDPNTYFDRYKECGLNDIINE